MQRGVVILPGHVLTRAGRSPAQCDWPHSVGSGASCSSVSPGHGFWPSAQHWPLGSHVSASQTKLDTLPVSIKCDTGFNPAVTEHEVLQHDTDTAQTALREHPV